MKTGLSFLKSKVARRFVLLFILCAVTPTALLIVVSYGQVVKQVEEQSYHRLKREVQAYSLSLFDRIVRIDNDLQAIGRQIMPQQNNFTLIQDLYHDVFKELFRGVVVHTAGVPAEIIYGSVDMGRLEQNFIEKRLTEKKPFIITISQEETTSLFYFGVNINRPGLNPFTVIAEVRPEYLWGIGPAPLLPPMTELSVYDRSGKNIISSIEEHSERYQDVEKKQVSGDLQIFQFTQNGKIYHAGIANLFLESRFQDVGWTIILSRAQDDIMSALHYFKKTFPFIILFFLLIVTYLSVLFIRKGLDPLERLQKSTRRIAQRDFTTRVDIQSGDEFEELGKSFNDMAVKLDNHFQTLTVLNEIDTAILSSLNRQKVIATTLQRMKVFFHCETTAFVKMSAVAEEYVSVYTLDGRRESDPVIHHSSISVEEMKKIFAGDDLIVFRANDNMPAFLREICGDRSLHYLGLPLLVNQKIQRVLFLGHDDKYVLTDDQLSQARKIANQLAIALSNSILVDNLTALAKGTMEALARTVDAKSKWTFGHSERVAALSMEIGRVMCLPDRDIESLNQAGLLHDIGKIGIPLAILDKPTRLSESEYAEIQRHPVMGGKILEPIEAYNHIIPIILQHHEKYDGSGYPAGLKGEDIDIRARIMAVADVWDALVSERPYRDGWLAQRAKNLIFEGRGKHFDPVVVEAFFTVQASK